MRNIHFGKLREKMNVKSDNCVSLTVNVRVGSSLLLQAVTGNGSALQKRQVY